jgi:hypothetical protein
MYRPLVSIIILNFNGGDLLSKCLRAVIATDYPFYETIVVDNASTDGSFEIAKKMFRRAGKIRFIGNNKNVGYCNGNNIGIHYAQGDYIALLNSDVIVTPNWLNEIMKEVARLSSGFYVPKLLLLDNPRILDSAGNVIHLSGIGFSRGLCEFDLDQYNKVEETAYAGGACFLVSKKAVEEIGLLDPIYFAFNEDNDWGWRGRMFGMKSYYIPSPVIYHKWGASWGRATKKKFYFIERNRIITLLKNYSKRSLILLIPILSLTEISVLLYAFASGWLPEKIAGYSDLIKLREYIKKQRKFLQQHRKVSDEVVIRVFSNGIDVFFVNNPAIDVLNHILEFLANIVRPWIK